MKNYDQDQKTKKRYKLQIECDESLKEALRFAAKKRFNKANASIMVRALIADYLNTATNNNNNDNDLMFFKEEKANLRISIPNDMVEAIDEIAIKNLMTRNNMIQVMMAEYLNKAPLLGTELTELKKSNYELSKLGTNLNQITKVINTGGYLSKEFSEEATKKINSIRPEVRKHIDLVSNIIHNKGISFEIKKGGNRKIKVTKKE
jgi:hypothetical protein